RTFDRLGAENVAACLARARGELETARRELPDVAGKALVMGAYELLPLSVAGFLRLSTAGGEARTALTATAAAVAVWETKGLWPLAVRALPALAEAMAAADRRDEALALVDRLSVRLGDLDAPMAAPALAHARAHLTASDEAAAAHFLEAAAGYELLGAPYEAAQARELAAGRLFEAGDPGAGEPLRAAMATFRDLAARWDLDRAAQLARRHGVTVKGRYPGGPQGYGADLSPREREMADLAAAGLTNREIGQRLFVSPRTVEKHLGAALRKLGLRSRAALGAHLGTEHPRSDPPGP
ncbi:MAG: helix-turn-helix transcriptional regulator, partial [Thermoactinospora sp.]|nr:helix-turn-helix transcriptional regulator [Thermoactinospora sp.]